MGVPASHSSVCPKPWCSRRSAEDDIGSLVVLRPGQRGFHPIVANYLKRISHDDEGWARRLVLPMTKRDIIAVDPWRGFGQPLFVHGGAPLDNVVARIRAGEPLADVAADFEVPEEDLREALAVAGLPPDPHDLARLSRDAALPRRRGRSGRWRRTHPSPGWRRGRLGVDSLAEAWPSGRRHTPGKRVGGQPPRGFEPLSLRQATGSVLQPTWSGVADGSNALPASSPGPEPARLLDSRSGSSFRNSTTRNAAATMGTPARNTAWTEWATAWTTPSRTGAGSARILAGLCCSACGSRPPARARAGTSLGRYHASRFVRIAPKMATPNEPPIERKKVAAEVAVPRSRGS